MGYGRLTSAQLENQVHEELDFFHLPPDWREGREQVEGFAIDGVTTQEIDDAVTVKNSEDGGYVLSVSVADVATFLSQPSGIRTQARRRGATRYSSNRTEHMWPQRISGSLLSLRDGQERPVVTTHIPIAPSGVIGEPVINKGIIRARRYSYDSANAALERSTDEMNEEHLALSGLLKVAQLLHRSRNADQPFNDELATNFSKEYDPAQVIVRETMIATNRAATRFMIDRNIPAIFRVASGGSLLTSAATYSGEPRGHRLRNGEPYARLTSPLRRFADFVCQANVVAYLDNEPYPFVPEKIQHVVNHLNYLESQEHGLTHHTMQQLERRFADGMANQKDVLIALSAPPTILGADKARVGAIQYLVENPQKSRSVLNLLVDQKKVLIRRRRPGELGDTHQVIQDSEGNTYPYISNSGSRNKDTAKQVKERNLMRYASDIETLAKLAGIDDYELPWHLTKKRQEVLAAPRLLDNLQRVVPMGLQYNYEINNDRVTAQVCIIHNGEIFSCTASESTKEYAQGAAAYKLIKLPALADVFGVRNDIKETDAMSEEAQIKRMKALNKQGHGPRHYLLGHLRKLHRDHEYTPQYTITEIIDEDGNRQHLCTLGFCDQKGSSHITEATSTSKKKVQDLAAFRALQILDAPAYRATKKKI